MNIVRKSAARTQHRRDAQREALIEAAERLIAEGGPAALKARDLAGAIGVALGALYNLVPDLDALNLRVASRTMARMESCVLAASRQMSASEAANPAARLIRFAHAYRRFASDNTQLWRALFEHRGPAAGAVPEWLIDDQLRLFGHVSAALAPLAADADERELFLLTRTLFGAVHGVVLLGLEEKLAAVPAAAVDQQLTWLVSAFCSGLAAARNPT